MNGTETMKTVAMDEVTRILTRRLEKGGISTSRPDFYFQCRADEPEPYVGGFQVRVRTWRHWSDARVEMDADTGELTAYSIVRYSDPPNDGEMTQEEAVKAAEISIQIPPDAVLRTFYHFDFVPKRKVARLEWERYHQGLRVDGDYLFVSIHPKTHRIVEFAKKWRTLRLT